MILPIFDQQPKEAALIGRMLAGYGELELELMRCVSIIRDEADFDIVLKSMFRARGETQRIDIADAIGRQYYESYSTQLATQFSMAVGWIRHCLKIRNQYAHCHWYRAEPITGRIAFINLEEIARLNVNVSSLSQATKLYVDHALLETQLRFFDDVQRMMWFLHADAAKISGKGAEGLEPPFKRPTKQPAPPPLHIRALQADAARDSEP